MLLGTKQTTVDERIQQAADVLSGTLHANPLADDNQDAPTLAGPSPTPESGGHAWVGATMYQLQPGYDDTTHTTPISYGTTTFRNSLLLPCPTQSWLLSASLQNQCQQYAHRVPQDMMKMCIGGTREVQSIGTGFAPLCCIGSPDTAPHAAHAFSAPKDGAIHA